MKIAVIIERADIKLGGAERSVLELTKALQQAGGNVSLLSAWCGDSCENTVELCPAYKGRRTPYRVFKSALQRHLSKNNYDIIHSVLPFSFADVYQPRGGTYPESIVRNAASYQNLFLEIYKRATALTNFRRLPLLRAEKQLCRKGNKTVAVALSEYVKRQFRQHYDLAEERVKVIPNGIKLPLVPDNPELIKKEQFDKWGIRQCESPVFLFAAHNFRLKGLSPLIKAFSAALEQANRKACLVVIGRDNPKPYKKLAERLGGGKNIFFCPPAEKPAEMLTACDAVVLPTFYDPCSRFTLEALALFKPVITTRYNGVCDFITDGREGKIIDSPNDIDAITDAIIFFMNKENISHAEQNIKMGSLRSEISNQRVARQLNGLYEDIITKR